MKILLISDEESPFLWDYYQPGRLDGIDLILSAGDLAPDYLSFLVTMGRAPVMYVHGNHDGKYESRPPEGCECIEDTIVVFNGLRILGMGGCLRYHPGDHQYTEREMARRVAKLHHKIKRLGGVDIVVTHAPPKGLGDADDPAHQGFECFLELMELYQPKFLLHGHVHPRYTPGYGTYQREHAYLDTKVINVCERYVLDVPDSDFPEKHRGQILWKTKHKD